MKSKRIAIKSTVPGLAALFLLVCAAAANATPIFGNVTDTFSLNNAGYDTAGGATPDQNFFHTTSGIEVRNSLGALTDTILLPGGVDVYGLGFDGNNLSCSNMTGSEIYTFDGSLWDLGLGISESGARGLASTADNYFLVVDDGANIARINKLTGATSNIYAIDSIMGEGLGLGIFGNTIVATNGTDKVYKGELNDDFSAIENWEAIQTSGLPTHSLYGAGFNLDTGNLILNQATDTGLYAEGIEPAAVPEPGSMAMFAAGVMGVLGVMRRRSAKTK